MSVDTYTDHGDYGYGPPELRPRRRWPMVLLGVGLAVLLLFGLGAVWVQRQINPSGSPGEEVEVVVTPGMSTSSVADLLEEQGVIKNATIFSWYARFKGADDIKAGTYSVRKDESLGTVINALEEGAESETDRMTVPEGLTLRQIAERIRELPGRSPERFLELASNGTVRSPLEPPAANDLEGLLLPETYFIEAKDDEQAILTRMVDAFDQAASELDIVGGSARLGITPYQAVIVASMIEREAKVPEDRGPIARVIYNRLAKKMPLQIDATVLYSQGRTSGPVLFRDLETNSPYNTYKVSGLPPGPIAAPGRASLEAALNPPPGTWLYYVLADENGKHAFATTSQEFERYRAEAQRKGLL